MSGLNLALDQGGHASRALVFDETGSIIATAAVPVRTSRPAPGRVEHDAEEVVRSVERAATQVIALLRGRGGELRAAGFAAQRSSIVCWDRVSGEAISPVISWQDVRGADWMEGFRDRADLVRRRTGLVLSPHYGASKLRWCLENIEAVRAARDKGRLAFGPMASFVLFRLLKERPFLVDPATASRTLLLDLRARDWCRELLDLFAIPGEALPRVAPCRHRWGRLRAGGIEVPLRVATGDQPAALFACGEPRPDEAVVNVGTGAFVQRLAGKTPLHVPGLLAGIAWQDRAGALYVVEGTVNGAGAALDQASAELGIDAARLGEHLDDQDEPPLFLNGVSGLGSPFWVSRFDSRYAGDAPAPQKLVAVLESVVFLLRVNLDAMSARLGAPRLIRAGGGLAGLDGFCRRLAALTGLHVERPDVTEATARGHAYLVAGRPRTWPRGGAASSFEPRSDPLLQERYTRWRSLMAEALPGGTSTPRAVS